jgi:hypothetical protein
MKPLEFRLSRATNFNHRLPEFCRIEHISLARALDDGVVQMPRPTWSVTRSAIPEADKTDFSGSVSERLIEHPQVDAGKGIASGRGPQLLRHYVPTLDALPDPKKLLPPIFAGEVDGFLRNSSSTNGK